MALPECIAIKSNCNEKYLRYIYEDVKEHGFLRFSGEEIKSSYTKYRVQVARTCAGLVHIRSCYNNKYWVRWNPNHRWIVALADEPDEDTNRWTCTLFEPVFVDADADKAITVRFRHVQLGKFACLRKTIPPLDSCLFVQTTDDDDDDMCNVFTIINCDKLLGIPPNVAFKGDNGNYLSACTLVDGKKYLKFSSTNIEDPSVSNEVSYLKDTTVTIKSKIFNQFWIRSDSNWISPKAVSSKSSETEFQVIPIDNNVIALRNLGNNYICERKTITNITNCLNADKPDISDEAHLIVEETVRLRKIYNVNFQLLDARFYDQSVLKLATGDFSNKNQNPKTVDVKLSYTDSKSSTWNASFSLNLGVNTNIQSDIPLMVDGEIEILENFTGALQLGEPKEWTNLVERVHHVTVPPMTTVKVTLLATRTSFDVPFSYSQFDTLFNNQKIIYNKNDGVYTGINFFNFDHKIEYENL